MKIHLLHVGKFFIRILILYALYYAKSGLLLSIISLFRESEFIDAAVGSGTNIITIAIRTAVCPRRMRFRSNYRQWIS